MTKAKKILFITQEIAPYVPDSPMTKIGRELPQAIQEKSREIRTFMPKWGIINERRNQLHEVIRLSGMNLIIDETDHPLIIKVASITSSRMQVYFIDNDDYFGKRGMSRDEQKAEYPDNAERAVFYARGVLETVKKLRWTPEIIHCQGWMSSIIPYYIKTAYADEPSFRDCRTIFTPSEENLTAPLPENFDGIIKFRNTKKEDWESLNTTNNTQLLNMIGMKYADGVSLIKPDPSFREFIKQHDITYLAAQKPENFATAYSNFYDKIWSVGKEDNDNAEDDD
ncbi:MAG: glycogen/starch synthase [Bacteroidaceae bacterium]|nr:glycogen/starch synthase [Bacteroidaceae bacterium]